jgi:ATP-binding cassette, subfamily C (CFTR/MRP), member 2
MKSTQISRGWFQWISVGWLNSLLTKAQAEPLTQDHLLELERTNQCEELKNNLLSFYHDRNADSFKAMVFSIIWKMFLGAIIMRMVQMIIMLWIFPLLISESVAYLLGQESWVDNGILLALFLGFSQAVATFSRSIEISLNIEMIHRVRTTLMIGVYDTSMRKRNLDVGNVINMINNDINNVAHTVSDLNAIWSIPLQITMASYLLYQLIGVAMWTALGVALLSIFLTFGTGAVLAALFDKAFQANDLRVGALREVLYGILY